MSTLLVRSPNAPRGLFRVTAISIRGRNTFRNRSTFTDRLERPGESFHPSGIGARWAASCPFRSNSPSRAVCTPPPPRPAAAPSPRPPRPRGPGPRQRPRRRNRDGTPGPRMRSRTHPARRRRGPRARDSGRRSRPRRRATGPADCPATRGRTIGTRSASRGIGDSGRGPPGGWEEEMARRSTAAGAERWNPMPAARLRSEHRSLEGGSRRSSRALLPKLSFRLRT